MGFSLSPVARAAIVRYEFASAATRHSKGESMRTGSKVASDAARVLRKKSASKKDKSIAASDLSQRAKKPKVTGKKAATEASSVLRSKKSTKLEKELAASDLAQRRGAKKKK